MVDAKAKKKVKPKVKPKKQLVNKIPTKNDVINQMATDYRNLLSRIDSLGIKLADFELGKQRLEESFHWIRSGIERLPESEGK